jgi:putative restriction endonuclease
MSSSPLTHTLTIGETLTQDGVEHVFDTDFGYQFRGITYRSPDEGKYIILLINKGEVYTDEYGTGAQFTYEGEGVPEKGDQQLTTSNRALIQAIDDPIPVYLFTSEEGVDRYRYQGIVDVEDYRYVNNNDRMVYRFEMQKLGVSDWGYFLDERGEVETASSGEPSLTEDRARFTESKRVMRSSIFSRKIKKMYEFTCAVCGSNCFSPQGRPEVESAHIYPKYEGGANDLRNGIALCRFHHWAFDRGWFALTDGLEVRVNQWANRDPPEQVDVFKGEVVADRKKSGPPPHPLYLTAHRELHDFD